MKEHFDMAKPYQSVALNIMFNSIWKKIGRAILGDINFENMQTADMTIMFVKICSIVNFVLFGKACQAFILFAFAEWIVQRLVLKILKYLNVLIFI